jgi:hypothetical protein
MKYLFHENMPENGEFGTLVIRFKILRQAVEISVSIA